MGKEVAVVCPTKGRAGKVITLDAISPLTLCVAESDEADYRAAYPDADLLVHPDTVLGISAKRQWICDEVGDVFMVDDDVTALVQCYDPELPSKVAPEIAWEIVQNTARTARAFDVYLWGLANSHDSRYYNANKPFRFTGWVNAYAMGLFAGSRLRFPEDPHFVAEDFVIAGMNAYYYRRIFADTRWGFQQVETFAGIGGLSAWRTTETVEESMRRLRQMFGKAIETKVKASTAGAASSDAERTLRLPW